MNKYIFYLLLILATIQSCHQQDLKESQIIGKVIIVSDSTIKIGDQNISINKDGRFTYTNNKEWPVLLGATYSGMEWTIFMKPGSNLEISIPENIIDSIQYHGDSKEANTYLLDILPINHEVNNYLYENWLSLHKTKQVDFVAKIDSLKNIYFKHLTSNNEKYKAFSKEFIEIWNAKLDYGFNQLILRYPERHLQYTKTHVELNKQSIEYALSLKIDKQEYLDILNYKIYARTCIDFEIDNLLKQDTSAKNYNIKKIEAVFPTIDKLFSNQYLKDYWLSEYLNEHIDNNGIINSEKQLIQFYSICKTDTFKNKIDKLNKKINTERKGHEIYVYKTENYFALEAHVFRPKGADNSRKRPAIAIFHGGGWVSGKPSWAFGRAKHFAKLGMVGVAIQYRLSNFQDITPVEALEDTRDLMIWLRQNADSLGINPNKIAGEGWSAGGHLITSAAFFPDITPDNKINSSPNALVLKSPALETDGWCTQLLSIRDIDPKTLSPLDNIKKGMYLPPMLILQGRTDNLTPTAKAQLFQERMEAANYKCELVIYEDCGHLFTPSYLDDTRGVKPDEEISKLVNKKADKFLIELGYIEK